MSTLTNPANSNPARWNLVISEQTNIAVRSFLALKGFKKGDLSSFVEEAVRWRVFDLTLGQVREGFNDLGLSDAKNLLDEALQQVRSDSLSFNSRSADTNRKTTKKLHGYQIAKKPVKPTRRVM